MPSGPGTHPAVFVSYSHRDARLLADLLPYLKALERQNVADVWADTELKGGNLWKQQIEATLSTASIAVLLISQAFLTSDFINREELPRIFRRQQEGRLTVLPIYLSPSTVTSEAIRFIDDSGVERDIKLSDFQGFGTPDRTLRALPVIERQKTFVRLHDRILELASGSPQATGRRQPATPGPDPSSRSDEKSQFEPVAGLVPPLIAVKSESRHGDCSAVRPAGQPIAAPSAVILDRHYAYTLTSYCSDVGRKSAAHLPSQYHELFDVLTCAILLFDEILLEQHHVSSVESHLNQEEAAAFDALFTSFSISESIGSLSDEAATNEHIQRDLADARLRPLIASHFGRRPVPKAGGTELLIYVNRVLLHAKVRRAAIFVKHSRLPIFRYKLKAMLASNGNNDVAKTHALSVPTWKNRSLDQLAALRALEIREPLRRRAWGALLDAREGDRDLSSGVPAPETDAIEPLSLASEVSAAVEMAVFGPPSADVDYVLLAPGL